MANVHRSRAGQDEAEFQRSLIAAINEASPDGILVVDDKGIIVSHNRRVFDIFGIAPGEFACGPGDSLKGTPDKPLLARALQTVRNPDGFLQRVRALYADPSLEDQCEIEMNDGRTLERHSRALRGEDGQYLGRVWFFSDITAHKQAQAELQQLSRIDPLTGVANRRYFFERAADEIARARRFGRDLSVIMLDIDRFKFINDRWGHAAGDGVLAGVCEAACAALRRVDLFARIGGEEFAVLVPDTDLEGAVLLADRVRQSVAARSMPVEGRSIRVTLSAGVAMLAPGEESVEDLLRRSDLALYEAKNSGRDCTRRAV